MGAVRRTEAAQPWSQRIGGGFTTVEDVKLAADFLDFDVLVGPPHVVHGFFMIRDPANPRVPRYEGSTA